jgi:hypothetical protein
MGTWSWFWTWDGNRLFASTLAALFARGSRLFGSVGGTEVGPVPLLVMVVSSSESTIKVGGLFSGIKAGSDSTINLGGYAAKRSLTCGISSGSCNGMLLASFVGSVMATLRGGTGTDSDVVVKLGTTLRSGAGGSWVLISVSNSTIFSRAWTWESVRGAIEDCGLGFWRALTMSWRAARIMSLDELARIAYANGSGFVNPNTPATYHQLRPSGDHVVQ